MSDQLQQVVWRVEQHMSEILGLFKPGGKITVVVRRPGEPTQDFCLTNDDLVEARALLTRRIELGNQSKQT